MYRAPLKEIRFALHELTRDDCLYGLAGFEDYSADYADAVLEQAAHFAETVLAPLNELGDREGAKWSPDGVVMPAPFKDAYRGFVDAGWARLRASADLGGLAAPAVLSLAVDECWASSNLAFKLCPMLTRGAVEAIERCGSAALKAKYLPKMISGEWTGTMNLTEPQAGSDLGAIRTRAVRDGRDYKLFGQKIFITYGEHDYTPNIIHLVLARIDGAPPGTKGISMFIVPKVLVAEDGSLGGRNDVRCVSIERKLGIHASPTCVLAYGDHGGATGYLVGEANRGLEYMFIMMNAARLSVGLEGYALGEMAFQRALDWARSRVQGRPAGKPAGIDGKSAPIVEHADVKRMLLTMKAGTDASRAIALYGALQLDLAERAADPAVRAQAQARGDLLIPIIKAWSTERGLASASLGVQIHGGMGFIEDTGAAQHLRDVRITTIYEGTTGIQAGDLLSRKIIRDGGAGMLAFIELMRTELQALEAADAAARDSKASALAALDILRRSTGTLLELAARGLEQAQAVAVHYLGLCGTVIGAWTMAKAHDIAVRSEAMDPEFYAGKRQIARFYMQQILPEADSLARIVAGGSASVTEADSRLL